MENNSSYKAIRKSKRLKDKEIEKQNESDQENNCLPVRRSTRRKKKSNLLDESDSELDCSRTPKLKCAGLNKSIDSDSEASVITKSNEQIKTPDNIKPEDSDSDVAQDPSLKKKRLKKKLNDIESDSENELNCHNSTSSHSGNGFASTSNINQNSSSDTDCSTRKSKSCKLKRLKGSSNEDNDAFKTPTKKKFDEMPISSVKRSARLKMKSESSLYIPSRSTILENIEYTPVKDVKYYRQNVRRGIKQNNLVKWLVFMSQYFSFNSSEF